MNALLAFLYRKRLEMLPDIVLGDIFPPIAWLRKWMRARLRRDLIEVGGHKMQLDPNDSLELSINGVYEPELVLLAQRQIKPGATVVDIGANIGYFTLIFARSVGPQGRVFAFEPDPVNFRLLRRNVELNGYKNVTLVNKAVSDRTQTLKLFQSDDNLGDHRIYDSGDDRPSVCVEAVRLDDFFEKFESGIDVIKMDIQGAEYLALKGMSGLLDGSPHLVLFMEFWPYGLFKCGADPKAVIDLLEGKGFVLHDVRSPEQVFDRAELDTLLKKAQLQGPRHANFFCKRGE